MIYFIDYFWKMPKMMCQKNDLINEFKNICVKKMI